MTTMPVFPLNALLLPGCRMPLQIFEKRYLDMVSHCMRTNSEFCVALLRPGAERHEVMTPNTPALEKSLPFYSVGTSARIVDFGQRDNGLLAITIEGRQRVILNNAHQESSGLWMADTEVRAEITAADMPNAQGVDAERLDTDAWAPLLEKLLELMGLSAQGIDSATLTQEQMMNYLIMLLPLPSPLKQELLETDSHPRRWHVLEGALQLIRTPGGQR